MESHNWRNDRHNANMDHHKSIYGIIDNYGALSMLLNYADVKLVYGAPSINYGDQKSVIEFR